MKALAFLWVMIPIVGILALFALLNVPEYRWLALAGILGWWIVYTFDNPPWRR